MRIWVPVLAYTTLSALFIAVYWQYPHIFLWLVEEDHPVEWLTFLAYLLASILFMTAAGRHSPNLRSAWFTVLLAAGCFVVAGEEISWGQRLVGFSTPELIAQHNYQREFTFHNLGEFGKDWPRRIYVLALFFYVVLFPLATRLLTPIATLARRARIVVPSLWLVIPFACSLSLPVFVRILRAAGQTPPHHAYVAEVMELFSGLLFLHFAALGLSRSATETRRPTP